MKQKDKKVSKRTHNLLGDVMKKQLKNIEDSLSELSKEVKKKTVTLDKAL